MTINKTRHDLESSVLTLEAEILRQNKILKRYEQGMLNIAPIMVLRQVPYRFRSTVAHHSVTLSYDEELGIILEHKELETETEVNKRKEALEERIGRLNHAISHNEKRLIKAIEELNNYTAEVIS